jgi:hypothetical protein
MAMRRPMLRSVLAPALVIVGVAALVALVYHPWYLNYDTRYALVWARDLVHGFTPEYGAAYAPTPHPLWTAVALLALPFGSDGAGNAMTWLVLLSFGAVVLLTYLLGAELFNRWVGAVAAVVVLSRPAVLRDVVLVYLDVPFAALIVGAVLLEARRRRRGTAVLVVLFVAGLLRPEAWGLALLYVAYLWRGLVPRDRLRYAALALLAPVVWFAADAIITGDALHSLHGTADLAEVNGRHNEIGDVPYWSLQYFAFTVRLPVLLGIPVGLWFAWRRGLRDSHLPFVTAAVLVAGFAAGPILGLPLIARYMRLPAVLLIPYFALACAGWTMLAPSRTRFRWGLVGAAFVALSLAYGPAVADKLDGLTGRRDRDSAFYSSLRDLARQPRFRAAFARCPHVSASDHRPVPFLRWWLDGDPGSVTTVENGSAPGALYVAPRRRKITRMYYGVNFPTAAPPAGYREVARSANWRVLARPGC